VVFPTMSRGGGHQLYKQMEEEGAFRPSIVLLALEDSRLDFPEKVGASCEQKHARYGPDKLLLFFIPVQKLDSF